MEIRFEQLKVNAATFTLDIANWHIQNGQSWGVFCAKGDAGSLLSNLLCGEATYSSGEMLTTSKQIAQVSLTEQQRLLEQELAIDDTDFTDQVDTGSSVYELIYQQCDDKQLTQSLIEKLDLGHLQETGFRLLSTGETRRLMLARAVASRPELLILNEPYSGLDIEHRKSLASYLEQLSQSIQMMVIVSREEDMPGWIEYIALFNRGRLDSLMPKEDWDIHPIITQIKAQSEEQSEQMLELIRHHKYSSQFENPIFQITNGKVAYTDHLIFSGVNWRINKGEHWQVKGPNGSGKSTLLGLIFGDHPQCYSNDIQIFGHQRGSGESIWEIKQHIGLVSSGLHLQYRVNCSALDVILSGFYDSIGLYQRASQQERAIALAWLEILHMSPWAKTSFRQLEYGQQRLLLIARALVKQPTLLILDEPYQGLDYLSRRLVKNTLEMLARENLSQLLYVSHYQDDSLESIRNYLEFVPDEVNDGYLAIITQEASS